MWQRDQYVNTYGQNGEACKVVVDPKRNTFLALNELQISIVDQRGVPHTSEWILGASSEAITAPSRLWYSMGLVMEWE